MNQILSYQNSENGRKYIRKNVKALIIFLVLFAIILIAEGAWNLYTNKNKKVNIDTPKLDVSRNQGKTILNINSNIGIQKIIYVWDDMDNDTEDQENVVTRNGEKLIHYEIPTSLGVNNLIIKLVDSNGNSITYDPIKVVYDSNSTNNQPGNTITAEIENDHTDPTVEISGTKGKVTIIAKDETRMDYITYSWNGGQETKITGLSADEKSLTTEIDVLKGTNKLTVKAYDKAGNTKVFEQDVFGTNGPNIKVRREDDNIIVTVTDEFEITKIQYNFNGEETVKDHIEGNSYECKFPLVDGENYIIVTAYEQSIKSEFKGKTSK